MRWWVWLWAIVVVIWDRGQTYESLEQVKAELSPLIPKLMPDAIPAVGIPFLSLGDDIGSATVVYTGRSELSGELTVRVPAPCPARAPAAWRRDRAETTHARRAR